MVMYSVKVEVKMLSTRKKTVTKPKVVTPKEDFIQRKQRQIIQWNRPTT